jgi:hypothetical protein
MKTPSLKERAAMAHAETIGAAEQNRADWWQIIDLRDRQRAVGVAGLPKERANDPIASFSDEERSHIRAAIRNHVSQMELIARCFDASNTNVMGYLH